MIDIIKDWYGLLLLVAGGVVTWLISTRTSWFRSNTVKAEEEAKQQKLLAQAKTVAAIERINAGDATEYGVMLEWMKAQLIEQAAQHQAIRKVLEDTISSLRLELDGALRRAGHLVEDLAEARGRLEAITREFEEFKAQEIRSHMLSNDEKRVLRNANADLQERNRKLWNDKRELGGNPSYTDIAGPKS